MLPDGRPLLVKRDDRTGPVIGGNKVRALEWLLGEVRAGERVLTVGPRGSSHALTTALCARLLGANVTVVRWNQEMNTAARAVDARLRGSARIIDARSVPAAYVIASIMRLRGARWIPAGAVAAAAVLGHVNAALELADQIAAGECERPGFLVVPFGSGGTVAGLSLGLAIAGLETEVIAVRVVPRILGRARRVARLADAAAALIERVTGERVPRPSRLRISHAYYGGAYGRPIESESEAERSLTTIGAALDDTYSRKAFAAAVAVRDHLTLFWLTFDGRLLNEERYASSGSQVPHLSD